MRLSWWITRLKRNMGHCASFRMNPGKGITRGRYWWCTAVARGRMQTWVWKKKWRGDKRRQLEAERQNWHLFSHLYVFCQWRHPLSRLQAEAILDNYMSIFSPKAWFYSFKSNCLHQITHSSMCPKMKSSSQNFHVFSFSLIALGHGLFPLSSFPCSAGSLVCLFYSSSPFIPLLLNYRWNQKERE